MADECHANNQAASEECAAEKLTVMPDELDAPMPQHEPAAPAGSSVCPYLRAKTAKEKQNAATQKLADSPLENLDKLIQARHIFHKAEHYFRACEYEHAEACYGKVSQLVPGSRWDVEAQSRCCAIATLKMLQEAERSAAEESEAIPQHHPLPCEPAQTDDPNADAMRQFKEKFAELLERARSLMEWGDLDEAQRVAQEAASLPRPDSCSKVAELVEEAQRAYASGCHDEAWDMLEKALTLDPNCPAALALQEKLMGEKAHNQCDRQGDDDEDVPTSSEDEPCETPDPREPMPCPGLGFKHSLPSIDPAIVSAMKRVAVALKQEVEDQADPVFPVPVYSLRPESRGCYADDSDTDEPPVADAPMTDLAANQQAHYLAVLKWIESMNSGGNLDDSDTEESEEPLFLLETDLDPEW
jgi:tetratricopeptide (TPR) repeat protein